MLLIITSSYDIVVGLVNNFLGKFHVEGLVPHIKLCFKVNNQMTFLDMYNA